MVHNPAAGVKNHAFSSVSDPTRVGDTMCISCNAASPDHGCRVNRQSDYGYDNKKAKFAKNHQILSKIKV
jgi:hypothetical protein